MINKRDFLKFIGMAPVAAPMIADSITDVMKQNPENIFDYKSTGYGVTGYGVKAFGGYPVQETAPYDETHHLKKELEEITSYIFKIKQGIEDRDYEISNTIKACTYVDNLKSVSKSVKFIYMQKEKNRLDDKDSLYNLEKRMKEIKDRLGILGVLF